MKPNKGFITVLMMVLISISLSTFSRAAFDTFSDVPNDSPFHESIFYLAERGIVCGEGNGRYVPDAPVTVRQWATMLCRALGDAAPLNYDDDCIRQGYSDGWLEMTAITAPDSDLCRYAIYKSGFAAFGVDLQFTALPERGQAVPTERSSSCCCGFWPVRRDMRRDRNHHTRRGCGASLCAADQDACCCAAAYVR